MKGGDYDSQLLYEIIQYLSDYIYEYKDSKNPILFFF